MAKLPTSFNVGDRDNLTVNRLLDIIERMYTDIADAVNKKPDVYERASDGLATDVQLSNGSVNINTTTNKIEMLASHNTPTSVSWITLG